MFLFENVPGILSAKPGNKNVTERIYEAFNKIEYSIIKPSKLKDAILDSSEYEEVADMNSDATIDILDVIILVNIILGN